MPLLSGLLQKKLEDGGEHWKPDAPPSSLSPDRHSLFLLQDSAVLLFLCLVWPRYAPRVPRLLITPHWLSCHSVSLQAILSADASVSAEEPAAGHPMVRHWSLTCTVWSRSAARHCFSFPSLLVPCSTKSGIYVAQ